MPEKPIKKTVSVKVTRERQTLPKIIILTGFRLRLDKVTGLLDVYLEAVGKNERVSLDFNVLASNLDMLKQYLTALAAEPDDACQREDLSVAEQTHFANIVHCSNMGRTSETIFGVFSISDWVEATRSDAAAARNIVSLDSLVAISTAGVQKKLILEIVLMVSQQGRP